MLFWNLDVCNLRQNLLHDVRFRHPLSNGDRHNILLVLLCWLKYLAHSLEIKSQTKQLEVASRYHQHIRDCLVSIVSRVDSLPHILL